MAVSVRPRSRSRSPLASVYAPPKKRPRFLLDRDLVERLDWVLLSACAAIAIFGIVMIYSASRTIVPGDPTYFVKRQVLALFIGAVLGMVILRFDYRKWRDFSLIAYIGVVVLLFLVISPFGSSVKGHQAWFQLPFGFQLQPSELAKFGLIVALAGYVNEYRHDIDPWRLVVIVGLSLVPIALVQLQGDLGTNIVLIFAVIGLLAVAGVPGRYLAILTGLGLTLIFAVISLGILQQYQVDRLTTVFSSSGGKNQTATAYNQNQSVATISTGGFNGLGLFNGPQTKLGFVPEQQTDFIFTAVGEELGFVGGTLLLALFGLVIWRTWRTARLASDFYGTMVCAGVLSL
ncbi:MAG TPA: FtsW/RodA/SpoVE family cell cycle protein, partial [Acidimicrobiia bacterium]|nr:FtsW/RodA/SpoVE family cell cycle protein [Acidimicrobiia bacterium]